MAGKRNLMKRFLCASLVLAVVGCATTEPFFMASQLPSAAEGNESAEISHSEAAEAKNVVPASATAPPIDSLVPATPFSVRDAMSPDWVPPQPWDLSLDEAIQIALANSTILRDLGARVIQAPSLTPTIYGPAIRASDPRAGIEAALSAFDAQMQSDLLFELNNRVLNNEFLGGGVNFFQQDLARFENRLSKQTASGTLYTLRHNVESDFNNAQRNLFDRAWSWNLEGEVRQPLFQGRGTTFNRIAGPSATPGVYNGVMIALLDTDTTVAELEVALRDYLSDVENAYWDLYFAYVDLEVKTKARDRSLNTLRLLEARKELPNAEKDKIAQAKEQYFRFEEAVQNALGGRLVIGTRTFNGSGGGTFQGIGGVYANERRLRLVAGLPINDGRLLHPTSLPPEAPTIYDWNDVVGKALSRRTELRRQQLIVERQQLELVASRNFTLPRLDALGRYRYRGLGDHLYDPYANNVSTNKHEWFMGLSLSYPVGFRQAHAAVHNAQLRLSRELQVLSELERQVTYGVSNAIAEESRAYEVLRFAINRAQAAGEQYEILYPQQQQSVRQFDYNALLDSERRLAEAETNQHAAAVQYALAVKNLNFEMGTLLEYFNIHLAGGQWPRRKLASHQVRTGAAYTSQSWPVESLPASVDMQSTELPERIDGTLNAGSRAARQLPTQRLTTEGLLGEIPSEVPPAPQSPPPIGRETGAEASPAFPGLIEVIPGPSS